jgi:small subunit ribosomal protein S12
MMVRMSQLINNARSKKQIKSSNDKLNKSPQKKAICLKIFTMSPKKPNSANRRVAKVNIASLGKRLTVKIPGEIQTLQQHSTILIRGAGVRDLIGVRYSAIRGKFDFLGVKNRKTSRSVYGVKKS